MRSALRSLAGCLPHCARRLRLHHRPDGSAREADPPPPPPPTHPIILFVHGWNANATTWTTMIGRFKTDGWQSSELAAFCYDFSRSNATTAGIIKAKIDSIRKRKGERQVADRDALDGRAVCSVLRAESRRRRQRRRRS